MSLPRTTLVPLSPSTSRPPSYSASNLVQGSASFGFHGVYPSHQPIGHDSKAKRERDFKKRRVSDSSRQRTPMSCDRCKLRKIKCINPTPGPCDYCSRMKFNCQITAQRKHRPLYFTSDEQFQWMIALLQHFVPDINLELEGLKAVGKELGIQGPAPPGPLQTPMRSLPPSLGGGYTQRATSTPGRSEATSEISQSPRSEMDIDDEVNAAEGLLTMTDTGGPSTPSEAASSRQEAGATSAQSQTFRTPPSVASQLPPRALADIYVDKYFADVNDIHCVLSYTEFMSWYHEFFLEKPVDFAKQVIIFTVLAFGSKDYGNGASDTYIAHALNAIGFVMGKGGLEAVQALVLLSLYSMHDFGGCAAWTYAGAAIRVAHTIDLLKDNEFPTQQNRHMRQHVWWTLYDLERFLSANLSLPSSITDDLVDVSLPLENREIAITSGPQGYYASSTSLAQILGRTASYLTQSQVSIYTFVHYLSELQEWSDTLPESLQPEYLTSLPQSSAVNLLNLRWLDAVMVAMKPFLASLARFGGDALGPNLRKFFRFCADVASIAARETLSLMRHLAGQKLIKGLTAFDRHFLLQSASILVLSSVVHLGKRDERLRYRECIEMLLKIPGGNYANLIRDMRTVESRLERFAATKVTKAPDAANIFDSPGLPTLSARVLIAQFVPTLPDQDGHRTGVEDKEENLARWIPKRVAWEDVPEFISFGLKREGVFE